MCVWQTRIQHALLEGSLRISTSNTDIGRLEIEKSIKKKIQKQVIPTVYEKHQVYREINRKYLSWKSSIIWRSILHVNFECLFLRDEKRNVLFGNTRCGIRGENYVVFVFQGKLTVLEVLRESEIISNETTVGNKFTHRRASEMRYNDTITESRNTLQKMSAPFKSNWMTRPSKLFERKSLTAITLQGFRIPIGGAVIRKIHHKRTGTTDGNDCSIPRDRYILSFYPRNVAVYNVERAEDAFDFPSTFTYLSHIHYSNASLPNAGFRNSFSSVLLQWSYIQVRKIEAKFMFQKIKKEKSRRGRIYDWK